MNENQKLSGRLLIVDDNIDLLKAVKIFLKRYFEEVETETNPEKIPSLLQNNQYDIILLDMNFTKDVSSGHEGYFWLDKILGINPLAVVVLITAYGDVQTAVKAIKAGATDFVLKPWDNEKLLATIYSSLKLSESKQEVLGLREKQQALNKDLSTYPEILGESNAMKEVFNTINRVAETDANVLILGENGTGKELVAKAIHNRSHRSSEVFMSIDMGSISETLFESELFGHRKGAFTDARENRIGKIELSNKGTLFLDEIGNLTVPMQAKLLTVLQNRKLTPVGDNRTVNLDVRLISATNMDISDMVANNSFRQDLLYRINTIEIHLPPLRERSGDIPLLANHFLQMYAKKYNKKAHKLSSAAIKRLEKHSWPGNVRELQHAMERAVIMSNSGVVQPEDFNFSSNATKKENDASVILDQFNWEDVERILIKKVLAKNNGNITHAASEMGLTRSSFYRRLEKYGL
ncbi:MAG: sigma-54-dependent Fis family transcriptional regulator [Cyclobacteriaceae bacterium]|nr:sigma-54-dependent Fis family transcriptional regulator [Cyclobacteriaceae bacterium]